MATFTFYQSFAEAVAEGVHNLGSDTLELALTNAAPNVGNHTQLTDVTQVSYTYCSARTVTVTSSSQTGGVYSLVLQDLTLSASGGSVGPFQYVVLFNQTAGNDELIGYLNYGSSITLNDGEDLDIDWPATATVSLTIS